MAYRGSDGQAVFSKHVSILLNCSEQTFCGVQIEVAGEERTGRGDVSVIQDSCKAVSVKAECKGERLELCSNIGCDLHSNTEWTTSCST
jgi:hypothetical protein